jgi:tRNA(Met) C34 N-acetyltransferase TmcA
MTRKKNDPKTPPARKLHASWEFESAQDLYPWTDESLLEDIPKQDLTKEQEADLIIKRLKQTPQERRAEEQERRERQLINILAEEIKKEIDADMLKAIQDMADKKEPPIDQD